MNPRKRQILTIAIIVGMGLIALSTATLCGYVLAGYSKMGQKAEVSLKSLKTKFLANRSTVDFIEIEENDELYVSQEWAHMPIFRVSREDGKVRLDVIPAEMENGIRYAIWRQNLVAAFRE